jgi:GGDEF domain-containing protein
VEHDSAGEVFGKRVLVEISHTIERFALAAPRDEPLIVVALFQKLSYFERETAVYRDIAGRGALTVVGLTEDFPPHLPTGVRHALIGANDPLAREWSVTVLGPRGGATLVALDLETLDAGARTLEEGRLFRGHWSFRREHAYHEVLRLRSQLSLPPHVVQHVDDHLRHVLAEPEPHDQEWREAPLRFATDRIDQVLRERTALATAQEDARERDPRSGLYNDRFLKRWTAGLGAGTLPIGLAVLRVSGIADVRQRYGLRAELAVSQNVARILQQDLADTERAVRLTAEDFLVVLPARPAAEVRAFCDDTCDRLGRQLDQSYPFVNLPATAVATVTRSRPLPVDRLLRRLDTTAGVAGDVAVLAG